MREVLHGQTWWNYPTAAKAWTTSHIFFTCNSFRHCINCDICSGWLHAVGAQTLSYIPHKHSIYVRTLAAHSISSLVTYAVFQLVNDELGHLSPFPCPGPLLPGHQPVLVGSHGNGSSIDWSGDCVYGSRHSLEGEGRGERVRGRERESVCVREIEGEKERERTSLPRILSSNPPITDTILCFSTRGKTTTE